MRLPLDDHFPASCGLTQEALARCGEKESFSFRFHSLSLKVPASLQDLSLLLLLDLGDISDPFSAVWVMAAAAVALVSVCQYYYLSIVPSTCPPPLILSSNRSSVKVTSCRPYGGE